jgi:hypothetical protein
MKRCPQCNLGYTDATIEFCLEDGTRLEPFNETADEPPTVWSNKSTLGGKTTTQTRTAETFADNAKFASAWAGGQPNQSGQQNLQEKNENSPQTNEQPEAAASFTVKILALAPIIVALSQNYWQWLYMADYNSFKFPAFLWSVNFYIWLGLLVSGIVLSVFALRKNVNRNFAVVSLIILAINFLLCIVPRR